ncbi:alpha/beta fold hydrolase [Aspergillus undulatus]|uniref:alpha/beta fold hydrolase n=1 Tax=Aspergillus undulatus TaxID=1810928 RepID=UPI003CCCF004
MTDPITLISSLPFHRRLTLPTPSHGEITLTYADLGNPSGPALLCIPGMFASRYLGIPLHVMAERAGVRLLVVDRFGMGASSDVPAEGRVRAWVEVLPALLRELGISKVNLVSHSAGTIYLLNTWKSCRGFVGGVVVCLAPWVDPSHSKITSMQMAQLLPAKVFNYWNTIPRWLITQASPVLASSGAVMRRMTTPMSSLSGLSGSGSGTAQEEADKNFLDANYKRIERDYGVPVKDSEELTRLALKYMFSENTVGANGEALVCLRKTKGGGKDWGIAQDYVECARTLHRLEEGQGGREGKVTLRAYFAEKDAMVGRQGQKYFEESWRAETETGTGTEEDGKGQKGVEFVTRTVKGTDHDTLAQAVEVWEEIFSLVK